MAAVTEQTTEASETSLIANPWYVLIDGKCIMKASETKFLGVIIDNKLNWKPHRYVCTKVAKRIGIILKARKVFNHATLSTLYYNFLYP